MTGEVTSKAISGAKGVWTIASEMTTGKIPQAQSGEIMPTPTATTMPHRPARLMLSRMRRSSL